MRVLGIDPGSETTGWGVVEGDSDGRKYRLIEFGALKLKSSASFSSRLLKISRGLEEVIARLKPDGSVLYLVYHEVSANPFIFGQPPFELHDCGVSERDLRKMVRDNPLRLLGLN